MCGISCVVALGECTRRPNEEDKKDTEGRLSKSLEQIRHRGPDSTGTWISQDGRVGRYGPDHHQDGKLTV